MHDSYPSARPLGLTALLWLAGCGAAIGAGADARQADVSSPANDSRITVDLGLDSGPAPQPRGVDVFVTELGVFLRLTLNGAEPLLLRYDTGAPSSVIDTAAAQALGLQAGQLTAALGEVELGQRPFALMPWIEASTTYPGLPGPVLGVAGNDLFADFSVGIDFRRSRLWLTRAPPDPAQVPPVVPAGLGRPTAVPLALPGGYLAVDCAFAPAGVERCLLDIGSITSLALERHWQALDPPDPHTVPLVSHDNQGNPMRGYFQRAAMVRVGGLELPGDVVSVAPFPTIEGIGRAIGEPLVGLIGMQSLLAHYTLIDYLNARVLFYPYLKRDHLPPSPFVGFGMIVGSPDGRTLRVDALVPDAQPAAVGVREGDHLVAVDGLPLASAELRFTWVALIAGDIGEQRRFRLQRAGEAPLELELVVEDLLPPLR